MRTFTFSKICHDSIHEVAQLLENRQHIPNITNDLYLNLIKKLMTSNETIGIAGYEDGQMKGYLIGKIKIEPSGERQIWMPYEGIAIDDTVDEAFIMALYTEASKVWLLNGLFKHYAILPCDDPRYISAFQRLSFAYEQVHGILNLQDYRPFENILDLKIRNATSEDAALLEKMADIIFSYQNQSPVYAVALPEVVADIRKGYKDLVNDEEAEIYIAEQEGVAKAFQVFFPCDVDLMIPDKSMELSIAGTWSNEMGNGIGKSIMNDSVRHYMAQGYEHFIADWRITNIASSTFWEKCGFKPVAHRMYRQIDQRISWANFENPVIRTSEY